MDFSFPVLSNGSSINIENIPNIQPSKFLRRPDLPAFTRLEIVFEAYCAKIFKIWGTITDLALFHNVSRTFIYNQLAVFEEIVNFAFGVDVKPEDATDKKDAVELMASLRMEGKCSIGSIVTIMNRFDFRFSSQGTVSQYLNKLGTVLTDTLNIIDDTQPIVLLSDEIFSDSTPILITVEPKSTAILKIQLADKRRAEEWKKHWLCLVNNGFEAIYVVTDEGTGLCAGHDLVFDGLVRQPDTFHAIAHRLGIWIERLEKTAYKAIGAEYDSERKLASACSNEVIAKRTKQYEEARSKAKKAVDIYDNFFFLYHCVISELKPFHSNNGKLRDRKQAEDTIHTALDMLESLENKKISKTVSQIRRTMPNLLNYFDVASKIVAKLEGLPIDTNALSSLCLAWQWHKAKIKAKKAARRNLCNDKEQFCLDFATGYLQEDFDIFKDRIYKELDSIVQSSALVECINSIVRPYLNNSKGQINQEALNLIMHYHNHRRYVAGERKGKTPIEILTGKKQENDWIELLFELVEEKEPQFFSKAA